MSVSFTYIDWTSYAYINPEVGKSCVDHRMHACSVMCKTSMLPLGTKCILSLGVNLSLET